MSYKEEVTRTLVTKIGNFMTANGHPGWVAHEPVWIDGNYRIGPLDNYDEGKHTPGKALIQIFNDHGIEVGDFGKIAIKGVPAEKIKAAGDAIDEATARLNGVAGVTKSFNMLMKDKPAPEQLEALAQIVEQLDLTDGRAKEELNRKLKQMVSIAKGSKNPG